MIYRHYKGDLYYLIGYATPIYRDHDREKMTTIEVVAVAKNEKTLEEIEILIVYDKRIKGTYYSYNNKNIDGVMCLYRGLDGQHWLRTRENFYEEIGIGNNKSPRFSKVSGELLFNIISDLDNSKLDNYRQL